MLAYDTDSTPNELDGLCATHPHELGPADCTTCGVRIARGGNPLHRVTPDDLRCTACFMKLPAAQP